MESQAVYITAPRQVEIAPLELAPLRSTEVRTETIYSAFSHGTEMSFYLGVAPHYEKRWDPRLRLFVKGEEPEYSYPLRYGYCNVSRIVECGSEVEGFACGDVVFGAGGHQTALNVDAARLIKLPSDLDPRLGLFLANLQTTLNGILDGSINLGETVVIFGQGVLGQMLSQLARLSGAGQVIVVDPIQKRLDMALQLGADLALNPQEVEDVAREVRAMTNGRGADVVYDVSASYSGLQEAIRTVAPRGTVVAMSFYRGHGTPLELGDEFHHNSITVKCSQVGTLNPALSHRWTFERRIEVAIGLLYKLELIPLITHTFPFAEAPKAYEMIADHPEDCLQVILSYE